MCYCTINRFYKRFLSMDTRDASSKKRPFRKFDNIHLKVRSQNCNSSTVLSNQTTGAYGCVHTLNNQQAKKSHKQIRNIQPAVIEVDDIQSVTALGHVVEHQCVTALNNRLPWYGERYTERKQELRLGNTWIEDVHWRNRQGCLVHPFVLPCISPPTPTRTFLWRKMCMILPVEEKRFLCLPLPKCVLGRAGDQIQWPPLAMESEMSSSNVSPPMCHRCRLQ